MSKNELDDLKEFILNELIRKDSLLGKMLSAEKQFELANAFAKTLSDADITLASLDVKNKDTLDTLKMGCRAQAAQMLDPSLKIDMRPALKPLMKKDNDEEKETALENSLVKTLKALLALKLSQLKKPIGADEKDKLEMKLKELAKSLAKNKNAPSLLKGSMDALIRESIERKSLYGGIDPEKGTGQVLTTVQGIQGGNQFARQDLSNTGETFMAMHDKADNDQPDPNGVRLSSIVNFLADGQMSDYEIGLQKIGIIPGAASDEQPEYRSGAPRLTVKSPGDISR